MCISTLCTFLLFLSVCLFGFGSGRFGVGFDLDISNCFLYLVTGSGVGVLGY